MGRAMSPRPHHLLYSQTPIAVSVAQACALSGLSRASLYRAAAAGKLPLRKLGSRTVILVDELRGFLGDLPVGGRRE